MGGQRQANKKFKIIQTGQQQTSSKGKKRREKAPGTQESHGNKVSNDKIIVNNLGYGGSCL